MSLNSVNSTLSSLKSCQTDIGTGMDIVTDVALDLVETQKGEENADLKKLETMMLDCARMDREISVFVEVVESVTSEARQQVQQQPEVLFGLSARVEELYSQAIGRLNQADLQNHAKVRGFKEAMRAQKDTADTAEDEDEDLDVAVTQSQVNFTCPLTQTDMENPVKNKKCNHHYEQQAILDIIKAKQAQKKKVKCPRVGCMNTDVRVDDLVLDPVMKKAIQTHKKKSQSQAQSQAPRFDIILGSP